MDNKVIDINSAISTTSNKKNVDTKMILESIQGLEPLEQLKYLKKREMQLRKEINKLNNENKKYDIMINESKLDEFSSEVEEENKKYTKRIVDNKQLLGSLEEELKINNDSRKIINNNLEKQKQEIKEEKNDEEFDPIKQEILEQIFVRHGCIYIKKQKYNPETRSKEEIEERITNFTMQYKSVAIFKEKGKIKYIKYIVKFKKNNINQEIEMVSEATANLKNFKLFLTKNLVGYIFSGNENDLEILKTFLDYGNFEQKKGIDRLGYVEDEENKKMYFVDSSNEPKGFQKENHYSGLEANLLSAELITKEELKQLSKFLFNWSDKENSIITVLYPICCLLKQKLNKHDIKLFHLFSTGEAGSGKSSSIENIILPMLGMDKTCINKAGGTKFTNINLLTRSNVFPVIFEEYKPSKMSKNQNNTFSDVLRPAYDGIAIPLGNGQKNGGKRDQDEYYLTSPIIVVGEASMDEPAIIERSMNLHFHKLNHNEFGKNAIKKIKSMKKILTKLGRSMLEIIMNLDSLEVKKMYDKYETYVEKNKFEMKSRNQEHCAKILIAYELFENLYKNFNLNIKEECKIDFDFFVNILKGSQDNVNVKSLLLQTLETYDQDYIYRTLRENWHYKYLNNGAEIAIDIKNTYHLIEDFLSNRTEQEVMTRNEFTRQLRKQKFVLDYKPVKLFVAYESISGSEEREAMKPRKCFIFDCKQLKKCLDIDNLVE